VTANASASQQEIAPHHSFISEVFHNLSQPLTALHCSLELALDRDTTLEQLRASLQDALENAQRLRERLLLVRALADATDPGDLSEPTDIVGLIEQLNEDILPLAEAAGATLRAEIPGQPILVRGNRTRLLRSGLCFMEYLLRHVRQGGTLAIRLSEKGPTVEIVVDADGSLPIAPFAELNRAPYSCEIEMARRTFRAAGGDFTLASHDPATSVWCATLNLV
jgi:signal transduction histidine kinase